MIKPPPKRPNPKQKPVIWRRSLTVCVAAFAEASKAIVCIADRAITYPSYGSPVQSDSGVKKIMDVGDTRWCCLFSGDMSFAQQVVARLASNAALARSQGANLDFAWMESKALLAYQKCYEELIENRVLRPFLLTKDSFLNRQKNIQPLDPQFIVSVNTKLQEFQSSCQLMFCGFDSAGPHIFTVVEPGESQWNDVEGHNAIGIGKEAATSRMAWSETERSESLSSVFYDMFDAKVASEIIQGVGYEWDGKILVVGKSPIDIPKEYKKLIDQAWIVNNRSPYADPPDKDDVPPKNWPTKLKKFCEKCLAPEPSPPVPPQS
jgi:hypothetical protein